MLSGFRRAALMTALWACALVAAPALLAQQDATLTGSVTDPSGAVVSGAAVTVRFPSMRQVVASALAPPATKYHVARVFRNA